MTNSLNSISLINSIGSKIITNREGGRQIPHNVAEILEVVEEKLSVTIGAFIVQNIIHGPLSKDVIDSFVATIERTVEQEIEKQDFNRRNA